MRAKLFEWASQAAKLPCAPRTSHHRARVFEGGRPEAHSVNNLVEPQEGGRGRGCLSRASGKGRVGGTPEDGHLGGGALLGRRE